MPFIRADGPEEPDWLEAFRRQVRTAIASEDIEPGAVLMMWVADPGYSRDMLIDAFNEETGVKPRKPPRRAPGSVQRSPFT